MQNRNDPSESVNLGGSEPPALRVRLRAMDSSSISARAPLLPGAADGEKLLSCELGYSEHERGEYQRAEGVLNCKIEKCGQSPFYGG